ncbi:MAG TPA: guanylate kinase [Longimicrobiaceae bacterium]|nr:guanylate kinase [Longimicrobiaceae bacterium]
MSGLPGRTFPLILSAPSGGGKTTIARMLGARRGDIAFSVSATTRPPRHYERDGRDYWFVSEEEFLGMAAGGELVEWARVHGNLYGTPLANLDRAVEEGKYLVLDIDIQGARQVRDRVPEAVLVFVLPPSGSVLADRLLGRGSEDHEATRRRLSNAGEEIEAAAEFDYVVTNENLEATVDAVETILAAEGRRASRLPGLTEEIRRLRAEVRALLAADAAGS